MITNIGLFILFVVKNIGVGGRSSIADLTVDVGAAVVVVVAGNIVIAFFLVGC